MDPDYERSRPVNRPNEIVALNSIENIIDYWMNRQPTLEDLESTIFRSENENSDITDTGEMDNVDY